MNQNSKFTEVLQAWMNTPDSQKDWAEGALLLLQLSGNRIMYNNISVNPKGKAEFIKGQLQKYLNFRLQQLTKNQVNEMQTKVDEIVEKVIKPAFKREQSQVDLNFAEREQARQNGKPAENSEFADFKAGKRADHDTLPAEIQALYVENLDLVHRMRELHLKLRTLSLDNATCPDSDRYPFLKEIIALDKKRVQNWDIYDHFIPGTPVNEDAAAPITEAPADKEKPEENEDSSAETEEITESKDSEEQAPASDNPKGLTEAEQPAEVEAKPKKAKATTKRTTKKSSKK